MKKYLVNTNQRNSAKNNYYKPSIWTKKSQRKEKRGKIILPNLAKESAMKKPYNNKED